ncbi:short transient receptor potential channel 3-like isoform X2 [Branchiostoma floridae]|nr:short transient receptor potential channel 3-like isoform X2 [Branchiostoma floridae]
MVWEKIEEIWTASVDAWNKWDLLQLLCHVAGMGCLVGGLVVLILDHGLEFHLSGDELNPVFFGVYLLAIAVIVSFARYMSMLMFSETIGPLLLSMYKMVGDIFKFMIVFVIIIIGFGTAFLFLYSAPRVFSDCHVEYYQAVSQANNTNVNFTFEDFCHDYGDFTQWDKSMLYLFMTLYGKFEFTDLDGTAPNEVQFPVLFIWLSRILFIIYITTSIIILLNMLIAMLSNSFSSVSSNVEVEWRFARSREMLKYIPKGRTLPPPFNLIPSPKSGWYFLKWLVLICRGQKLQKKNEKEFKHAVTKYKVTVKRLKARYLLAYRLHRDQAEG